MIFSSPLLAPSPVKDGHRSGAVFAVSDEGLFKRTGGARNPDCVVADDHLVDQKRHIGALKVRRAVADRMKNGLSYD